LEVGYGEEIGEVFKYIKNASVITVFFPKLGRSLVFDLRIKEGYDPLIKIMPMANSVSERIDTLKELRPEFPKIQEIVLIPWVGYVDAIRSSGLWDHLLLEIKKINSNQAILNANNSFDELLEIQQEDLLELLFGDKYETVWESEGS
tara:strand:+ start:359 stop:799 length:441 start_codon:yes stop_codon:yes gene_type:complete